MKMMFDLMMVCAQQLKEYLDKTSQKDEMLEMKEVMAKFTTDVIGLCAFGLQSNAISDSDSEFRQMGRQIFLSSPLAAVRGLIELTFPSLLKIFRIKAFPDKVSNFFIRTVKDVIEFRETNNVSRNDFMQLIIELKNKGKVQDDEAAKSEDALDGTFRKASENNIGEHSLFYI
jgi:cytochrome P450 family 6